MVILKMILKKMWLEGYLKKMLLAFHFIDRNSRVSNIAPYTMAGVRCIYGGRSLTGPQVYGCRVCIRGEKACCLG